MKKVLKLFALAVVVSFLTGCQATLMRSLNVGYLAAEVDQSRERFGTHKDQMIDVYRPSGRQWQGKTLPVMVFLYGGSWRNGKRAWYRFFAKHYALKGFVVMIPDYRKAPEFRFPVFMQDAAASVAFAKQNASRFNANPQQLLVVGHSAGAHIGALLCLDPSYLRSHGLTQSDITGFVGLAGPYDFLPMTDPPVIEVFNNDANLLASQPIHFARQMRKGVRVPPMLLIHGSDDNLVWPKNSHNLASAINERGGQARVLELPGVGHFGVLIQASRGFSRLAPEIDPAIAEFVRTEVLK